MANSKIDKISQVLFILAASVFLLGISYKAGEYNAFKLRRDKVAPNFTNNLKQSASDSQIDFDLFWQTWSELENRFVDKKKLDNGEMYYGAIKGMVSSLEDPYTFFLTPEENQQSKDDLGGKFEGIGAELGMEAEQIIIVAPLKNSPAQAAGLRAGDIILEVDGAKTINWTLQKAVSKIRGKRGTEVVLGIYRPETEEELDIKIIRDTIKVDSVELEYEDEVAILRLNRFGDNTNDQWDKAVSEISGKYQDGEIKAMVLDLRDNPGGYLAGSIYIAGEFLPRGSEVVTQQSTDGNDEVYKVDRDGKLLEIPLATLINKGSASASEIVSGALQHYKRTKIIGEQSFGKGSVQEAIDLEDGAGLHVTVAKWILPNGKWINSTGIKPDITVKNEIPQGSTLTRELDAQLDRAIQEVVK